MKKTTPYGKAEVLAFRAIRSVSKNRRSEINDFSAMRRREIAKRSLGVSIAAAVMFEIEMELENRK